MLAFCTVRRFKCTTGLCNAISRSFSARNSAFKDIGSSNGNTQTQAVHPGNRSLKHDGDDNPGLLASRPVPLSDHAPPPQVEQTTAKPSLMDQLFPTHANGQGKESLKSRKPRELPYMPLHELVPPSAVAKLPIRYSDVDEGDYKSRKGWHTYENRRLEMAAEGERQTILLLRNASKNLTEDDFRRVVPQGQHIEGWSLEQSNFIKVVPGRDLATLEQQNFYYLLFANQMAAFSYQGHVSRLSSLALNYTPSSVTSPAPPPPGYQLSDGTDLYSALQSYSLTPPSQLISLRQLQAPLSPLLQSVLQHHGYPSYVNRPDKLPHEVRLTLDGPQLHLSTIQFILHETALARSLGWSGGDERVPRITKWQPQFAPSATDKSRFGRAAAWGKRIQTEVTEEEKGEADLVRQHSAQSKADAFVTGPDEEKPKRRVPNSVYIVGFHTEAAAQSFIRYWHRRPMVWEGKGAMAGIDEDGGDLPAIADVELLW
nr:hypothetical protein CFP56_16492 [Quercus suber]